MRRYETTELFRIRQWHRIKCFIEVFPAFETDLTATENSLISVVEDCLLRDVLRRIAQHNALTNTVNAAVFERENLCAD